MSDAFKPLSPPTLLPEWARRAGLVLFLFVREKGVGDGGLQFNFTRLLIPLRFAAIFQMSKPPLRVEGDG